MSRLWELLKTHIETGNETSKVDLKQTLDLSTPGGRRYDDGKAGEPILIAAH